VDVIIAWDGWRPPRQSSIATSHREDATAAGVYSRAYQPTFADHSKKHIALTDLLLDHGLKIVANHDRVEVHVCVLYTEVGTEDIEQPSRIPAAIFTSIADEHSRHIRSRNPGQRISFQDDEGVGPVVFQ